MITSSQVIVVPLCDPNVMTLHVQFNVFVIVACLFSSV